METQSAFNTKESVTLWTTRCLAEGALDTGSGNQKSNLGSRVLFLSGSFFILISYHSLQKLKILARLMILKWGKGKLGRRNVIKEKDKLRNLKHKNSQDFIK